MRDILEEIKQHKLLEVKQRKAAVPERELEKHITGQPISLRKHLLAKDSSGILAEFKRKSPSKGIIHDNADAAVITSGYIQAGAAALSVLTDEKYFGGTVDDLKAARKNNCPILRKDFVVDEYQITEARAIGADVILLIAEILTKEEVKQLAQKANSLGMEVLMEMHTAEHLEKLNPLIHLAGINNRNLKTFEVDIETSIKLAKQLPDSFVKVAESGIHDAATLLKLKAVGFNGFLIGELFMSQTNPAEACRKFIQQIREPEKAAG